MSGPSGSASALQWIEEHIRMGAVSDLAPSGDRKGVFTPARQHQTAMRQVLAEKFNDRETDIFLKDVL
jgi:hypothetical protein